MDGELKSVFTVKSGVRQYCPLSPVLFALVFDPFFRTLVSALGDRGKVWAHADDLAFVLKTWKDEIVITCNRGTRVSNLFSRAQSLYAIPGRVSSFSINTKKTILVPLCTEEGRDELMDWVKGSPWHSAPVADSGRYLGFRIGPLVTLDE